MEDSISTSSKIFEKRKKTTEDIAHADDRHSDFYYNVKWVIKLIF